MAFSEQTIAVNLSGASYQITVRPGLLSEIGPRLAALTPARQVALLTDSNVTGHFASILRGSCQQAGIRIIAECVIPAGEQNKNLDQIGGAYDAFLRAKIERNTPILAFGGGVVGDMAGFVAATILRGVPFVQIPTSLLAMVDASVGGKTGIDHATGKNLIGAFHQPIAVLVDPAVLKTLPPRELRGGLAECIKHEIIRDAEGFDRLERDIGRALALDLDFLTDLIAHNVAIKARVVEADPFEKADRAHLNFGHTFGHAIETVSHYEYSHGESVALGMVAAVQLATDVKMLDDSHRKRIVALIAKAGLPTGGMSLPIKDVVDAMFFDKKVKSGKLRLVLPERIGHVVIRDDIPIAHVTEAVQSLRG